MFKNQFADGIFLSGIEGGRTLLPPILWNDFAYMTDEDEKAMFAYFKTIRSVAMLSLWLLLRLI